MSVEAGQATEPVRVQGQPLNHSSEMSVDNAPRRPSLRRRTIGAVLDALHRLRIGPWVRSLFPDTLSVIVHHRVCDPEDASFFGMKSLVSATPRDFERQLDFLAAYYNVVSLADVRDWVVAGKKLPRRAVLITFDDGYGDNLTEALPILKSRAMPAVIFIATGFVGDDAVFFCDAVAEVFRATALTSANLPLLGHTILETPVQREEGAMRWMEAAKLEQNSRHAALMTALCRALKTEPPQKPPPGTHVNWPGIRALKAGGFAIGAHTVTHPILSRIPSEAAETELRQSREDLERCLDERVYAFAYPNGRAIDFTQENESQLERQGYDLAFRADGSWAFAGESRKRRFAIRRVLITRNDDLPRFSLKVSGLLRLIGE